MKHVILAFALMSCIFMEVKAQWQPVEGRIRTEWAAKVDPQHVLPEYPRPIMKRTDWKNLNGLWKYAVIKKGEGLSPKMDGDILVPFCIESSLSGVGKRIDETQELVYSRQFEVPSQWRNNHVLLHFGAVDWRADVWVNDVKVGSHCGGYTPFSFDITGALNFKKSNNIVVKVWDPTDKGPQPRGKQVSNPNSIWYTPVSGIWQTVWLEPVAEKHIENLKIIPDIDLNVLSVKANLSNCSVSDIVEVEVYEKGKLVASAKSLASESVEVTMPRDIKLWSPNDPFLYDLKVTLWSKGKECDQVESYTAMRKYATRRDKNGIVRLELNNKALFQFGPLDQGWWPDGLYTAPTDEALLYDIKKTKDFGFNMIRKHIKVEPARWYTHCDEQGIIVWQDMPSGDHSPEWQNRNYFEGTELTRSKESEGFYRKEWKEIMDYLYSYPCIGMWVPFNEAWGQFKTKEIAEWTKDYDPSRLVNPASGGNFYTCGDILDLHNYPQPELYMYDAQRATVLGEYGGLGYVVKGHVWEPNHSWGYVAFHSSEEVTDGYIKYAEMLYNLIEKGFSAAVYTQTTDVEVEVNGLMTYDRKVIKMDEKKVREINKRICDKLNAQDN